MAVLSNGSHYETDEAEVTATGLPPVRAFPSAQVDDRLAAQRRLEARAASATPGSTAVFPAVADATTAERLPGPRGRASVLASLSLVLGVGSALTACTGVLAGPGVALGLLAAFAAIGGLAATGQRHVSGKGNATAGLLLGLGAIVIGTLTLTGNLPWSSSDTDQVMRIRDWLEGQAPWLFPNS